MWLVRLLMRNARPCARGRIRLSVGPSSTYAALTTRAAGSRRRLCSALATALATTLATGSLALCGAKRSRAGASCPNWEVISISLYLVGARSAPPRTAVVLHVPTEGARGRELAELVPDHRLGHEDRDVLAAVVHGDRVPEHVGDDRRAPRPGADDGLGALLVLHVHLLEQVVVDEGALLQAAWHLCGTPLPAQRFLPVRRRRTIRASEALRLRVRPSGLPFGLTGWRPPEVFPSPPPCGWSTGFMATPRTVGRLPFHRIRPALPQLMLDCSALPTSPTVARQRASTSRISPEGIRRVA